MPAARMPMRRVRDMLRMKFEAGVRVREIRAPDRHSAPDGAHFVRALHGPAGSPGRSRRT